MNNSLRYLLLSFAVVAIYVLTGLLGLKLAVAPSYTSPIFPPAGIALASLILLGKRFIPAVFIGSIAINALIRFQNGDFSTEALIVCSLVALGVTLQALVGKIITRPYVLRNDSIICERSVFLFLFLAGPCSCLIGASFSVSVFAAFGIIQPESFLHNWIMWFVGDSIGSMVFTPIVLTIFEAPTLSMNMKKRLAIYPSLILFGFVVWLFFYSSKELAEKHKNEIQILSEQTAYNMDSALKRYGVILESAERLFSSSDKVTRKEFHEFLKDYLTKYPGVRAINWNPIVLRAERTTFEAGLKREGIQSATIFSGPARDPVPENEKYIPVKYTEPFEPNALSIGYDTNSNDLRRRAMEIARDRREFAISSKIQLVQDQEAIPSLAMFYPVFAKNRSTLKGFVVGLFRIDDLITTSVSIVDLTGINFLLYDVTDGKKELLYQRIERGDQHLFDTPEKLEKNRPQDLFVTKELKVGGRVLSFELFPTREYVSQNADFSAWAMLLGGLILVILLQCLMMIIVGRTEMIQKLVDEKTSQLSQANAELSLLAKSISQDLVESNLNFRRLAEAMPDIVWVANSEGVIGETNSRWEVFSGTKITEVDWLTFVHPEDLSPTLRSWKKSLETGSPYEAKFRMKSKEGEFHWFIAKGLPIKNFEGKIVKWFGTTTDIHHQICAEEEKSQLMIRERTALEASKMKSAFLANMSHEIRTPINGVVGMTHLLKDTILTDEQREYTRNIESSASSLLNIINDILDFSKVEAGKMNLEIIDFDFEQTVQDSAKTIEFLARKKGLPLLVNLEGMPSKSLKGDPGRVRQVLTNLLNNAVKFTESGRVTLKVFLLEGSESRSSYRFEVEDTGIGISESTISKIFQPFDQADNSTTRRFGGTGLGLSISKQLVELMKGKIGVQSELGKGSTFWFELSFENGQNDLLTFRNRENTTTSRSTKRIRVLLAEDNQINQMVAVKQLAKIGCQCDTVGNGQEAIDALKSIPYDLVLMDCQMPEMDGYEATRRIRAMNADFSTIPIIAMTANAMTGDREKCLDAGMNDYVSKPIAVAELAKVIERWHGQKSLKLTS